MGKQHQCIYDENISFSPASIIVRGMETILLLF